MRIGILTGGGDCPGLNAVIHALVTVGQRRHGHEHVGLRRGWKGLLEGDTMPLGLDDVEDIPTRGGTILGSSRTNPFKTEGGGAAAAAAANELGLDAIVAIGGEDTLGVAHRLHAEHDLPTVGVPKTIDNDLSATDYTFGFWTAVQIATDAIDRVTTTAASHDRIIVVEVMGRHAGWLALESGVAGNADAILIPEVPVSFDKVAGWVRARRERGRLFSVIVVSEGVELGGSDEAGGELDDFGHARLAKVGVGERLAEDLGATLGADARAVVLGHVQRGGSPVAFDRALATRYGTRAAELVAEGAFGRMAALRGERVTDVPLTDAVAELKVVPPELYAEAETFFG